MDKINFQNSPNTTTPVNATNLNQVQTNVESAINSTTTTLDTKISKRVERTTFSLQESASKTLTFSGARIIFILSAKASMGLGTDVWIIASYDQGTDARTKISKLVDSSVLTYTINNRAFTITNSRNDQTWSCSITMLIGALSDITIA